MPKYGDCCRISTVKRVLSLPGCFLQPPALGITLTHLRTFWAQRKMYHASQSAWSLCVTPLRSISRQGIHLIRLQALHPTVASSGQDWVPKLGLCPLKNKSLEHSRSGQFRKLVHSKLVSQRCQVLCACVTAPYVCPRKLFRIEQNLFHFSFHSQCL